MQNFTWPLRKSLHRVSQHFGSVWSADNRKRHTGIDILAAPENRVFATTSGIVTKIGDCGKGWAQYILLDHDLDDYCSAYLHITLSVRIGERIPAGQTLGTIASIKAPHLHFNIWRGPKDEVLIPRGALPSNEYVGKIPPKTDPAFPAYFIDPLSFSFIYLDGFLPSAPPRQEFMFPRDLSLGCSGPDVRLLQKLLNTDPDTQVASKGPGSPGQETDHFRELTKRAVEKFQSKHNVASPGDTEYGMVGPKTRKKLQELFPNGIS